MRHILTTENVKPFLNYDKYISAIMRYNKIDENNFCYLFPDVNRYEITFDEYFNKMETLDGTEEFIEFVKQNKDLPSVVLSDHDCDGIMGNVILTMSLSLNMFTAYIFSISPEVLKLA